MADIDQVLLQGFVCEGIFDLEVRLLAVWPFGANEEAAIAAEELCRNATALEPSIVEIGAHRFVIGKGHRLGVMRLGECRSLFSMAGGTRLLVDESLLGRDQRVRSGRRSRFGGTNRCGERKQDTKQQSCPADCRCVDKPLQSRAPYRSGTKVALHSAARPTGMGQRNQLNDARSFHLLPRTVAIVLIGSTDQFSNKADTGSSRIAAGSNTDWLLRRRRRHQPPLLQRPHHRDTRPRCRRERANSCRRHGQR